MVALLIAVVVRLNWDEVMVHSVRDVAVSSVVDGSTSTSIVATARLALVDIVVCVLFVVIDEVVGNSLNFSVRRGASAVTSLALIVAGPEGFLLWVLNVPFLAMIVVWVIDSSASGAIAVKIIMTVWAFRD